LDEAIALPSEHSAQIARNTQLYLQQETGITHVVDPWAGSYYVESLTDALMQKAWHLISEVEAHGGMTKSIEIGLPKLRIEEAAARRQAQIDSGEEVIIGVNKWMSELISSGLQEIFQNASAVQERLDWLERSVREGTKSPSRAARELLGLCHDLSPRPSMGSGSPPVPDRQCAEPFEKTIA
jgi:methylmalonyl-CoA mutase